MATNRFSDETTLAEFLDAVAPELEEALRRSDLTPGQECLGACCEFSRLHPESQTAADLLRWAHGQTAGGAVEGARAADLGAWIAPEDGAAYRAMSDSVRD